MNTPQINLALTLRPDQLDRDLPTLAVKRLHSANVFLRDIPEDVSSVVLRVFKTDLTSHFDCAVTRRPDGSTGFAYVIGTCFPDVGTAFYEIHAFDYKGNATALGRGAIEIGAFSLSSTPITPGSSVAVAQVQDTSGAYHTLSAVLDESGNYTLLVE